MYDNDLIQFSAVTINFTPITVIDPGASLQYFRPIIAAPYVWPVNNKIQLLELGVNSVYLDLFPASVFKMAWVLFRSGEIVTYPWGDTQTINCELFHWHTSICFGENVYVDQLLTNTATCNAGLDSTTTNPPTNMTFECYIKFRAATEGNLSDDQSRNPDM